MIENRKKLILIKEQQDLKLKVLEEVLHQEVIWTVLTLNLLLVLICLECQNIQIILKEDLVVNILDKEKAKK